MLWSAAGWLGSFGASPFYSRAGFAPELRQRRAVEAAVSWRCSGEFQRGTWRGRARQSRAARPDTGKTPRAQWSWTGRVEHAHCAWPEHAHGVSTTPVVRFCAAKSVQQQVLCTLITVEQMNRQG